MKTAAIIVSLLVTVAAASGVWAGDKTRSTKAPKAKTPGKAEKARVQPSLVETNTLLTGSYLRRDVRRNGKVTDGPSQVVVIDRRTLEHSGAADVTQALAHEGIR